jgi:hypothetical protein
MNNQKKTTFTHEKAMDVTFYPLFNPYGRAMKKMRGYGGKYKGDISPGWAFWASRVLEAFPKACKIVWLHRDVDEVAESFIKQKEYKLSKWKSNFSGPDGFMGAYPVWEQEWSHEAVHRAVRKVFYLCKGINTLYNESGKFVFPLHISELNDEDRQLELLTWLGYRRSEIRLGMPHLNRWHEVGDGEVTQGRISIR